jgi:hypothetical protein
LALKVSKPAWIVDGIYPQVNDLIASKAQTIIWLDCSCGKAAFRVGRRSLHRIWNKTKLWNDNHETWRSLFGRSSMPVYVFASYRSHRRVCSEIVSCHEMQAAGPVYQIRGRHGLESMDDGAACGLSKQAESQAYNLKHVIVKSLSSAKARLFRRFLRTDVTWITDRIAVGGGIWNDRNMAELAASGVSHVINMQNEFDDAPLVGHYGIHVLSNPTCDDLHIKPFELFERGVSFALQALKESGSKIYIHCASGVHRAPMMAVAVLCAQGWSVENAKALLKCRRPSVDFVDAYMKSVEEFLTTYRKNCLRG